MTPQRREFLRLVGLGSGVTLAGCLDSGNGTGDTIHTETQPFVTRSVRPEWEIEGDLGRVVLVDSEDRERAVFDPYDLSAERNSALEEFIADIDYESERLLFVESAGPNACYDRLELTDIHTDERIRADAMVLDTSEGDVACAEIVSYPSTLARITFDDEPLDSASVSVTNGWGETETISATVEDPIGPDIGSLEGSIRPETEADPIEPLECDRPGVKRHQQAFDEAEMVWGNIKQDGEVTFTLRIDDTEFDYGDTARIRLENVGKEAVYTGNRAKYNLQAFTEAGWQNIRVGDEDQPFEYTDEAIEHPPGEGFEWTFELTEDGIV
ncbi:MAG: hypothetical protein V5A36_06755, partial [Natronomonas sp.]